LKWSSTKFDSRQTLTTISNLSTPTVTPINTNSQTLGGNPSAPSPRSLSSTHPPFHFQLRYLMPSEERPSTRPILPRFRTFPTASTSRTTTGTVLIPPQPIPSDLPALIPQVPVQTPITGLPPTSNSHPQPRNPDPPTRPICALVALTFVIVILNSPEHPQHPPVFLSGTQSTVINLSTACITIGPCKLAPCQRSAPARDRQRSNSSQDTSQFIPSNERTTQRGNPNERG